MYSAFVRSPFHGSPSCSMNPLVVFRSREIPSATRCHFQALPWLLQLGVNALNYVSIIQCISFTISHKTLPRLLGVCVLLHVNGNIKIYLTRTFPRLHSLRVSILPLVAEVSHRIIAVVEYFIARHLCAHHLNGCTGTSNETYLICLPTTHNVRDTNIDKDYIFHRI